MLLSITAMQVPLNCMIIRTIGRKVRLPGIMLLPQTPSDLKATWSTEASWNREDAYHAVDITDYFKEVMAGDQVMSIALVGESSDKGYDIHAKEKYGYSNCRF